MVGMVKAQQEVGWSRETERKNLERDRRSGRRIGARLRGVLWALVRTWALVDVRHYERILSRGVMWLTCIIRGSLRLRVDRRAGGRCQRGMKRRDGSLCPGTRGMYALTGGWVRSCHQKMVGKGEIPL